MEPLLSAKKSRYSKEIWSISEQMNRLAFESKSNTEALCTCNSKKTAFFLKLWIEMHVSLKKKVFPGKKSLKSSIQEQNSFVLTLFFENICCAYDFSFVIFSVTREASVLSASSREHSREEKKTIQGLVIMGGWRIQPAFLFKVCPKRREREILELKEAVRDNKEKRNKSIEC